MRDFLTLADLTPETMHEILDLAVHIKSACKAGKDTPYLKNYPLMRFSSDRGKASRMWRA